MSPITNSTTKHDLIFPGDEPQQALATRLAWHDLQREKLIALATDAVTSERSKRAYRESLHHFLDWWQYERGKPALSKALVNDYKAHLKTLVSDRTGKPLSNASVNLKLSALRKLIGEAADNGLLDENTAKTIERVKGVKTEGTRAGNWLTQQQAQALLDAPDPSTKRVCATARFWLCCWAVRCADKRRQNSRWKTFSSAKGAGRLLT